MAFFYYIALPMTARAVAVMAEGMAAIEPDIAVARDLAILRAKQQALEQLGIGIQARSITDQGKALDEMIMVQTNGFVDSYEILEEGARDGNYHVRLATEVKSGDALAESYQSIFRGRILAIASDGPGSEMIVNQLRSELAAGFFHVLGPTDQKPNSDYSPDYSLEVHCLVTPYANAYDIMSFSVSASIAMTQTATCRQVLHTTTDKPVIIYGLDQNQALGGESRNQFAHKVVAPLINFFRESLKALAQRNSRITKISITNLPDLETFRAFREYVKNIRLGMVGLESAQYREGEGTLEVGYQEDSLYLAAIIAFRPEYQVKEQGKDRIIVNYDKGRTKG